MIDVVCGVIINSEGKILACRRGAGRHLEGLWEFPGGKINLGETPDAALVREIKEELSVNVTILRKFDTVVEWSDSTASIRLIAYWCEISTDEFPVALEHSEILWCGFASLRELDWAQADLHFLEEILKR